MQVVVFFSVSLLIFFNVLAEATPLKEFDKLANHREEPTKFTTNEKRLVESGEKNAEEEDLLEYVDFEDDETSNEPVYLVALADHSVNSVRHLHQRKGEILVPCFGMWWPVGGVSYDYVEYYGGDYRRKRKRSKKQKKAAKMKKKKS